MQKQKARKKSEVYSCVVYETPSRTLLCVARCLPITLSYVQGDLANAMISMGCFAAMSKKKRDRVVCTLPKVI